MPNLTGGRNYKKSKHSTDKPKSIEAAEGQLYARIIQNYGNRNMLAYCNDNIIRLCHIRGSIRKDMWISVGDIVLVSVREFTKDKADKYEKGDILFKYDRSVHSSLKKNTSINPKLFFELEKSDTAALTRIQQTTASAFESDDDEDLFDHDGEEEEDEEHQKGKRNKPQKPQESNNNDDVDIDAI
jgi:translation initiation factor 1A